MVEFIKGLVVEAEAISKMENKQFTIIDHSYRQIPDIREPTKTIEKLVLRIKLQEDSAELDYFPNKTSQKELVKLFGYDLDKWHDQIVEFEVKEMMIGKETKKALFVKGV